jgi:alcohol dehydrogenase class IV
MHHGTANAVLLPHVLEFNRTACPDRYIVLTRFLDLPPQPESVSQWVRDLNDAIGIPDKLSAFGVTAEMIPDMVEKATEDGCHVNNPRPCTAEDMRALYEAAL